MAETPAPNLIHDPPSLPNSPHHKRTKKIEPASGAIGNIQEGRETPTPTTMASHPAPRATQAVPNGSIGSGPPQLQVKLLSEKGRAPTRGSAFAAGYDLYSSQDTVVPGRGKAMVETDISIAVPEGTYGRVAPRSGLAAKHSIDTGAGVIDADYRGPLKVILFNFSEADFQIKEGDRIAQLIVERIYTPEVVVVQELAESVRGAGGFGSTGGFATNAEAQRAAQASAAAAAATAVAGVGGLVPAP